MSDHIAQLHAYRTWGALKDAVKAAVDLEGSEPERLYQDAAPDAEQTEGEPPPTRQERERELQDYLHEHDLSEKQLRNVSRMKRQFFAILQQLGFVDADVQGPVANSDREEDAPFVDTSKHSRYCANENFVKGLLCAALSPHIALHSLAPGTRRGTYQSHLEYRTKLEPLVWVSSQSVVSSGKKASPYVVYTTQEHIDRVNCPVLTEVTLVGVWEIVLLGVSWENMHHREDLGLCVVDDWIMVQMGASTFDRIIKLKRILLEGLVRKAEQPKDAENNARLEQCSALLECLVKAPVSALSLDEGEEPWRNAAEVAAVAQLTASGQLVREEEKDWE